jgi:hypothetical protein
VTGKSTYALQRAGDNAKEAAKKEYSMRSKRIFQCGVRKRTTDEDPEHQAPAMTGRSDIDLPGRLSQHLGKGYAYFKYGYFQSAKAAFEIGEKLAHQEQNACSDRGGRSSRYQCSIGSPRVSFSMIWGISSIFARRAAVGVPVN